MTTRSNRNGAEHLLPDESLCLVSRPQLKNVFNYSNKVPSRWVPVVSNKVPIAWIIPIRCPVDASKLFRIRCPSFWSCSGLQTPVEGLPAGVSRPLQRGCLGYGVHADPNVAKFQFSNVQFFKVSNLKVSNVQSCKFSNFQSLKLSKVQSFKLS